MRRCRPACAGCSAGSRSTTPQVGDRGPRTEDRRRRAAVVTALESGASSWPGLVRSTERDRAWGVEYLFRSCAAQSSSRMGIVVECVADTHVFRSLELGVGPFESAAVFSLLVDRGRVSFGEVTYDGEISGMGDHVLDMWDWLAKTHPQDTELRLYARRTAEFAEARG